MDNNQTGDRHHRHNDNHHSSGHVHHHEYRDDCCEGHHHHMSGFEAYFSFTTSSNVLVQEWTTATITGVVLGAVLGALLSIVLEALKCYVFLHKLTFVYKQLSTATRMKPPPALQRIFSSVLHMLHALTGYMLMLLAMTFNTWIMITIVLGAGIGHFLIRPAFYHFIDVKLRRHLRKNGTVNPSCECNEEARNLSHGGDSNVTPTKAEDLEGEILDVDKVITEDSSVGERDDENQPFRLWDPVRQSRQFQVKGKETSL